jgi:hypothetical protein
MREIKEFDGWLEFKIYDFNTEIVGDRFRKQLQTKFHISLSLTNGKEWAWRRVATYSGESYSLDDSIRSSIQAMLDGDLYNFRHEVDKSEIYYPNYKDVRLNLSLLPKEYQDLFRKLFSDQEMLNVTKKLLSA